VFADLVEAFRFAEAFMAIPAMKFYGKIDKELERDRTKLLTDSKQDTGENSIPPKLTTRRKTM